MSYLPRFFFAAMLIVRGVCVNEYFVSCVYMKDTVCCVGFHACMCVAWCVLSLGSKYTAYTHAPHQSFLPSGAQFIAIDLMLEWLLHVYHKLLLNEFAVLLGTFVLINALGLEQVSVHVVHL